MRGESSLPAPRRSYWIAKPRKPRFGIVYAGFLGVYAQAFIQFPRLLEGGSHFWTALLILVPIVVLTAFFVSKQILGRRVRREDTTFVDGAFGEQFVVELTIAASNKRIGADRGVLWFSDGLMGFSGRAASFVLAAKDIQPACHKGKSVVKGRNFPSDALLLNDAPVVAHIILTPLRGYEKRYQERLKRFLWLDERPEGERFWPPLEPYNEAAANEIAKRPRE